MDRVPEPRRDRIKGRLRDDIISGRLEVGRPIVERELAQRFGVSHAPVREALLQLATTGLVELRANRGARVAPLAEGPLRELFIPIRQAIEGFALRNVFGVLGRRDFDRWEEQIDALGRACRRGDAAAVAQHDFALHEGVVSGVAEGGVHEAWLSIAGRARFDPCRMLQRYPQPTWICEQHAEVVRACRSGDVPAAVRALESNIASELAPDWGR